VKAHQAVHKIATMCRVLGVSPSGYHAWRKRPPSKRAVANAALLQEVEVVHQKSRGTYGAPRVFEEFKAGGKKVGRNRIARLMQVAGIRGVSRRKECWTTIRDKDAKTAPDLVSRHFQASGPDQLWVADITYVPTWAGFLYLAIVLDVWSRKVIGWAMANHLRTELILDALNMALGRRGPVNVIHHSDQGCQYTSVAFGKRCEEAGVRPSMGSVGDAYDNAMAESFFATLECELIDRRSWQTKTEARLALFTYIEGWYNPRRRHSALGQISPANFERNHASISNGKHGLPTVGARVAGAAPPVDNPATEPIHPT